MGQLTTIGIQQVLSLLDRSSQRRERLAVYEKSLASLYQDPASLHILTRLVPDLRLPVLAKIDDVERSVVSDEILRRVRMLLEYVDPEALPDMETLRNLCIRIRAGKSVEPRYQSVVWAHRIVQAELYNLRMGFTFNPETNVAASAILLRHYIRYPWRHRERRLSLPFTLRYALAVVAYNQGPMIVTRILEHIEETGLLDLDEMDVEQLLDLYTEDFVEAAVGEALGARVKELYRHFVLVMECARAYGQDS